MAKFRCLCPWETFHDHDHAARLPSARSCVPFEICNLPSEIPKGLLDASRLFYIFYAQLTSAGSPDPVTSLIRHQGPDWIFRSVSFLFILDGVRPFTLNNLCRAMPAVSWSDNAAKIRDSRHAFPRRTDRKGG